MRPHPSRRVPRLCTALPSFVARHKPSVEQVGDAISASNRDAPLKSRAAGARVDSSPVRIEWRPTHWTGHGMSTKRFYQHCDGCLLGRSNKVRRLVSGSARRLDRRPASHRGMRHFIEVLHPSWRAMKPVLFLGDPKASRPCRQHEGEIQNMPIGAACAIASRCPRPARWPARCGARRSDGSRVRVIPHDNVCLIRRARIGRHRNDRT